MKGPIGENVTKTTEHRKEPRRLLYLLLGSISVLGRLRSDDLCRSVIVLVFVSVLVWAEDNSGSGRQMRISYWNDLRKYEGVLNSEVYRHFVLKGSEWKFILIFPWVKKFCVMTFTRITAFSLCWGGKLFYIILSLLSFNATGVFRKLNAKIRKQRNRSKMSVTRLISICDQFLTQLSSFQTSLI
jgi:hypothetical protein